jgi:hypothetical protein
MTLFDDRLVSIFSASDYCGSGGNAGAAVMLMPDGLDSVKSFSPLPYLRRGEAVVKHAGEEKTAAYRRISTSVSDSMQKNRRAGVIIGRGTKETGARSPPIRGHAQTRFVRSQRSDSAIVRDLQWDVIKIGKKM